MIFALAEILCLKKFGQADDLRPTPGSVCNAADGLLKILFRLRPARHLHQRHTKFLRGHGFPTSANKYSRESRQLSAISYQQKRSPAPLHDRYFIERSFGQVDLSSLLKNSLLGRAGPLTPRSSLPPPL